MRHGMPDEPRTWSLDGKAMQPSASTAPVCRCEACGAVNKLAAMVCEACGAQLRKPKERPEIQQRLVEAAQAEFLRSTSYYRALRWAGEDEQRLRLVAKRVDTRPDGFGIG
jgi:hypothetical protein